MNIENIDFEKLPLKPGAIVRLKTWEELLAEGRETRMITPVPGEPEVEALSFHKLGMLFITQEQLNQAKGDILIVSGVNPDPTVYAPANGESYTDEEYANLEYLIDFMPETTSNSSMLVMNTMVTEVNLFDDNMSTKASKLWNINPDVLETLKAKAKDAGIDNTVHYIFNRRGVCINSASAIHAINGDDGKAIKIKNVLDVFPTFANLACMEHNVTTDKNGIRVMTVIPELFGRHSVEQAINQITYVTKSNDYDNLLSGNPSIALYLTTKDNVKDAYDAGVAAVTESESEEWKNNANATNLFSNHTATKCTWKEAKSIGVIKNTKKLVVVAPLEDFINKTTAFDVLEVIHKSFCKETDDIYKAVKTANIDSILEQIASKADEKRLAVIVKSLETVGSKYTEMKKDTIKRKIRDLNQTEDRIVREYQDICSRIEDQNKELFLISNGYQSDNFIEFSDLVMANKQNITNLDTSRFERNGEIAMQIIQDVLYYDTENAELVMDNTIDYAFSERNYDPVEGATKEKLKKLFTAIVLTNQITFVSQTNIVMRLYNGQTITRDDNARYKWGTMVGVPNPHIHFHNCWGQNKAHIVKALTECNLVMAYNQVCSALAGINVTDSTVYQAFAKVLATTGQQREFNTIPCLRNNETGEVFSPKDWHQSIADTFKLEGE